MKDVRAQLRSGLVVSCHRDANDPLAAIEFLAAMAKSVELGGAAGLRVEGVDVIAELRKQTALPIIGFTKGSYPDGAELITPDLDDMQRLIDAGADVIAVDATKRRRPNGMDGFVFFENARARFQHQLWADCSTFREGVRAAESGADFVATTLSGYTPHTSGQDHKVPDFELIHELSNALTIPVIAEGRIWTPGGATRALELGAFAVVVGTAITRPRVIAQMFVTAMKTATAPERQP